MVAQNAGIVEKAQEFYKKFKVFMIIGSIIMILLGIFLFVNPFGGNVLSVCLLIVGVLIYGIERIVFYCKMPKELRSGSTLAIGIIWVLLVLVLIASLFATEDEWAGLKLVCSFNFVIGFFFGFTAIFTGISDICNCSAAEEIGRSKGGMIASGILGLIAGFIILSYPIGSVIAITVVNGLFLVIGGITLLCRCISAKN